MPKSTHDIIRVENLKIAIDLRGSDLNVIRGASFRIPAGKTVALVGESQLGHRNGARSLSRHERCHSRSECHDPTAAALVHACPRLAVGEAAR